ncbi:MAG TPA: hypothetical protein VEZ14_11800 [Dehalococcoidia bacterium]|nr:hypothetical protein [Dehalococcoidia bacterium]
MATYQFERDVRTPYSESYTIEADGDETGRVDLHFTGQGFVHATLCVPADADDDEIQELIAEVDERLVLTTDPERADFIVTVWRGTPAGVYSEDDEEGEDDDEEPRGNGRAPA